MDFRERRRQEEERAARYGLTSSQAFAIKLAASTHGVCAHGNTVKALVRKGLAKDVALGGAFGGGTSLRLTKAGYELAARMKEDA